jgi:hypothetical protein
MFRLKRGREHRITSGILRRHWQANRFISGAAEMDRAVEEDAMRLVIALLLIVYLVGVGVTLAPTVRANWTTVPASEFFDKVVTELPRALSWPVTAYRSITESQSVPDKPNAAN